MEKTMNFGDAIAALKQGKKVSRMGWNGKGMYLFLIESYYCYDQETVEKIGECAFWDDELKKDVVEILPSIAMRTADKKLLIGWLASQTDMLSEDWVIVE